MVDHKSDGIGNRRSDVRLASHKKIDAVVVDRYEQPIGVFQDAEIVNVSAGGMMMVTDRPADVGARILVNLDDAKAVHHGSQRFGLEALSCSPCQGHKHEIRCKLVAGAMPARLIYSW